MASTSSVYANTEMPSQKHVQITHDDLRGHQKANEAMGHAYATTICRRPCSAFSPFMGRGHRHGPRQVHEASSRTLIDIYNHGEMWRDFTYVEDLVRGIRLLIDTPPVRPESADDIEPGARSPRCPAPHRQYRQL